MVAGNGTWFFKELNVNIEGSFNAEPDITFPFSATHLILLNESSTKDLYFSFDGVSIHGRLGANETPITFDGIFISKIHFYKKDVATGGENKLPVRLWAWR